MLTTLTIDTICLLDMFSEKLTYSGYADLNDAALIATAANAATLVHGLATLPIAHHIQSHSLPSWAEWAMHSSAAALDVADGILKNEAVQKASLVLFGQPYSVRAKHQSPTPEQWECLKKHGVSDNPRIDDITDKLYNTITTSALIMRAFKNKHFFTVGALSVNALETLLRDVLKEYERKEAKKYHVRVHAEQDGKAKTKYQNIGAGILMSPMGRYATGRAVGVSVYTYGSYRGLVDLLKYRRKVRHAKARAGQAQGII